MVQWTPRAGVQGYLYIRRALAAAQFTDIVAIFDLLDIQLVHGWLVDPQVRCTTNLLPATLLDM